MKAGRDTVETKIKGTILGKLSGNNKFICRSRDNFCNKKKVEQQKVYRRSHMQGTGISLTLPVLPKTLYWPNDPMYSPMVGR
jgi:hypothetical protein